METEVISTNTATLPPTTDESSKIWTYVGIGVAIVLILIGAFVIYWFVFRKSPTPVNTVCSSQSCPTGQYCTSTGVCAAGSGDNAGHSCVKNGDCVYGYNCISQYCVPNTVTPVNDLPAQFQLMYTLGSSKATYYLDPSTSSITQTIPSTNFSYDHVNQILSINGGSTSNNKVNVSTSGALSASISGFPLTLAGSNSIVSIQYPCGSVLSYKGTNVFFPQVANGVCPNTFQSSSGAVSLAFTVQSLPAPPTTVNIQLSGCSNQQTQQYSQIQSPQYQTWSSLNNSQMQPSSNGSNMQNQPSWSSLNNSQMQQNQPSSNGSNMQNQPLSNNSQMQQNQPSSNGSNMQNQPSWSSLNNSQMQNQTSLNNSQMQQNQPSLNNSQMQPSNIPQGCPNAQVSSWNSMNNLPDTSISPPQNLFMQSTLPGQLFGGEAQKAGNFGMETDWVPVNVNF